MITLKNLSRDSGYNNQEKLIQSIESLKEQNIKIVIGPIDNKDFDILETYKGYDFYFAIKHGS